MLLFILWLIAFVIGLAFLLIALNFLKIVIEEIVNENKKRKNSK